VLDGNVERVMTRLHGETDPLPGIKERLRAHAARLTPSARPGDYAQAVMDLGATICTPRKPDCGTCPWNGACVANRLGIAQSLPSTQPRATKPVRHGIAYCASDGAGRVLAVRRESRGLLGGMLALPSTEWTQDPPADLPPLPARWHEVGEVRHSFTHFNLVMRVRLGQVSYLAGDALPLDELEAATPSVFAKACRLVRPYLVPGHFEKEKPQAGQDAAASVGPSE